MNHKPWQTIFEMYNINKHNFEESPFFITAEQIKIATANFTTTNEREVRVLCKQDTRESRPDVFVEKNLFLLPVKNGEYAIFQGEGYVDIPQIETSTVLYHSKLEFRLETSSVGNSEMQHLDFAYASSLIRTFLNDESLVLTIRGRKYTPQFSFFVGNHFLTTESVQTEVDAGYEGRNQVVLIEAKNSVSKNIMIRQLYYPFRQWQKHTAKKVNTLFFEKQKNIYCLWHFSFENEMNYNSIQLKNCCKFEIIE